MTRIIAELSLIGAVVAPMAGAVVSVAGKGLPGGHCRVAAGLAWTSALLAVGAAVSVAVGGPFIAAVDTRGGEPLFGLAANQLTSVLLVLVCVVGAVLQSFSLRYLQSDRTGSKFFAAANVVVVAMAIVCTSITPLALAGGWLIAGAGFVAVIAVRPDLPGVRFAARRTLRVFAIGDLAMLVAVVMITVRAGNVDLVSASSLNAAVVHLRGFSPVVAALIVTAALARSAQGPFGRWLPGTVSAPTPASVLLHAGVVNGGAILLVRLGALSSSSMLVMMAAFVVAALTATVATVLASRKADVKGGLALSTMGQMGFMVAECAAGAYLAALVHLIGHAMYKATLFFGSGSQVARRGQAPVAPAVVMSIPARAVVSAAAVAAAVGVMSAVPGALTHRGSAVLSVFVAATAASAGWAWSGRRPAAARMDALWAGALLCAGALYGLALGALGGWIAPALPVAGSGVVSSWWLLAVAGAGALVAGLARLPFAQRRLVAILVSAAAPPARLELAGDGDRPAAGRSRGDSGTGDDLLTERRVLVSRDETAA